MEANFTTPSHNSIKYLLREIEDKRYLLPEFQRNFTWSIEQTVDLFDSISRGIFIGALILSKPKFNLTCRELDERPRKGKGKNALIKTHDYRAKEFDDKNIFVVLDGQQRVTSIFRALKGIDEIYFVFKNPNDIPADINKIESLEQIINGFSSKIDKEYFSIPVSKIYDAENWREQQIKDEIFLEIIKNYPQYKESEINYYFDLLIQLKNIFHRIIDDKTLLSVFLLDMDLEKFCMFFERSNSKGIVLNFIDIITAKVYKGFNLRKKKEEFREKYNDISINDNQIVEAFVRYLCFIINRQVDKKTILENLDDTHFNTYWDEICLLYDKVKKVLIGQNLIFNINWLPYKTMFIPMMHYIRSLPHKDISSASKKQQDFFKFWFWSSMLNTRYGGGMVGSTNDIILEDCELLESIAKNKFTNKNFLKKVKCDFKESELIDLTSRGAIFTGIMSLMNYKYSFRELANEELISSKNEIHIHHIFPTKYIEENFSRESFEGENWDSILNKMLVAKIPNIRYGKKAPSDYLDQENIKNSKLKESLESQLIPEPQNLISGKFNKKYETFISKRYQLVKTLLDNEIVKVKEQLLSESQE